MRSMPAVTPKKLVVALSLSIFVALAALPAQAQDAPTLKVEFNDAGVASVKYGDVEMLHDGDLQIKNIYQGGKFTPDMSGAKISFDKATHTKTWVYPFTRITCVYEAVDNRLDFHFRVTNTGSVTLTGLDADLAELKLPQEANFPRIHRGVMWSNLSLRSLSNAGGPIVLPAGFGSGWAVLTSDEFGDRLSLDWAPRPSNHYIIGMKVGGLRMPEFRGDIGEVAIVAKNFATYNVSLRFGPPGSVNGLELAQDICKAYAASRPMMLNWPDRRPIGRDFVGNLLPHRTAEPSMAPAPKTQGDPNVRRALMDNADHIIKCAKADDCQGIVVWDIEGDQYEQITYVGDPRLVEVLNPEMDAAADEFFKKFRDANLAIGVCIRPTQISVVEKDGVARYTHGDVGDPVPQLAKKIEYAMKRWGATMFYIDTNVVYEGGQGLLISANDLKALLTKFPNILLIPELGYADYYPYSFPYGQMDMGNRGTPALIKAVWPDCAQSTTTIEGYDLYDAMVKMICQRDTLMWFANFNNTPVDNARAEAAYLMQGPPKALEAPTLDKALALMKDKDARSRYFAIAELGKSKNHKALAPLLNCLADKDWVIRKAAIAAIGELAEPNSVEPLAGVLRQSGSDLHAFAARALTRIGKPAIGALTEAANSTDLKIASAAIGALGATGLDEAVGPLSRIVDGKASITLRAKAVQSLGRIGNAPAADKVISQLEAWSDPTLNRAAIDAVTYGKIHGPRAVTAVESCIAKEKKKLEDKTVEKLDPKWLSLMGHALQVAKSS